MITYEYKCKDCGEEFEEVRRISEDVSHAMCPNCNLLSPRHYRTPSNLDTYFEGSTKDEYPVRGI
jgi:putative FmdB family regulatory protein